MSDRIRLLAAHVRTGSIVYDLCCDHGYIGFAAWDTRSPAGLYFVDRSERALQAVHSALDERGLTGDARIQVLCESAERIAVDAKPGDFILAGIGTRTSVSIIQNLFPHGLGPHRLILCPEKNTYSLRSHLRNQGYGLIMETVVQEGCRFREIMVIEEKGGPIHLMGEGFAQSEDPQIQDYVRGLRAWHVAVEKKRALGRSEVNFTATRAEA